MRQHPPALHCRALRLERSRCSRPGSPVGEALRRQGQIVSLLLHLDELVALGFSHNEPGNDGAVLLQSSLSCDWDTLHALLGRLSPPDRMVLRLLVMERLYRAEVAERVGVTVGALNARLWRMAGRLLRGGLVL